MTFLPALSCLAPVAPRLAACLLPLAQATDELSTQQPQASPVAAVISLVFGLIVIVSLWKIFTKAGRPGWASIVPIYNAIVLCNIAGKSGWWVLLMFIPLVNLIAVIIIFIGLAKNFGKGAGFGIGAALLSFIFLPILAFGGARYQGSGTPALT